MTTSLEGKTCIVTGGNAGIGKATAAGLAQLGARTIIVSRSRDRGEAALADLKRAGPSGPLELVVGDLGSVASIRALGDELLSRCPEVHVLVNNAGLWNTERQVTPDGYEMTFAVNHLGPFLLTSVLLDRLKASAPARIVNVSSQLHHRGHIDFDDLQYERGYKKVRAYCDSKLANVLFTRELARRLEGTEVTTNALHPGVVNTNLGAQNPGLVAWLFKLYRPFTLSPRDGAKTSLHVATAPELANVNGRYFDDCKEAPMSGEARDDEVGRRLWTVSEELSGLA